MTVIIRIFLAILLSLPFLNLAEAQQWQTAISNPGNNTFYAPDHPLIFVATPNKPESPNSRGGVTANNKFFGLDVLSANSPQAGNELWILLQNGALKKLFPLQSHVGVPGLIDSPNGDISLGSVVEPNISEDGRKVYFSYFHNAADTNIFRMSHMGADLYVMDLEPLLQNANTLPDSLAVKRLTDRFYSTHNGNTVEDPASRHKDAQNPIMANEIHHRYGSVHMHAVEMRTKDGLKLVYVSDKRSLGNSNNSLSFQNYNFNLHMADILPDGSLGADRQLQYYTTTSALSPAPLRNGVAFSYQASTEAGRQWQIQSMDSAGKWAPLIGYGVGPGVFHLGSFCVKTTGSNPGDYFASALYYNKNNEGAGPIWMQDLSQVGLNDYSQRPVWIGSYKMTQNVKLDDDPAQFNPTNNQFYGKFTSPRCGRPDEIYFAYTPTSANFHEPDFQDNVGIFRFEISYRPNLESFNPHESINPNSGDGLYTVVRDSSESFSLIWPIPVLSWAERTGAESEQQSSSSIIDKDAPIMPGDPVAQIGTSALYNTDILPYDCNSQQSGFQPNNRSFWAHFFDELLSNFDGLTVRPNQQDPCEGLHIGNANDYVLGIAINLTSNKSYQGSAYANPYETDTHDANGGGSSLKYKEALKLLGVYDVRNQNDQSFMAKVPANAPIEFKLLDKQYGKKLVDVRSWHSLKARETRNDCGGCHNHRPGEGVPFEGKHADNNPPADFVEGTAYVEYDANCNPEIQYTIDPSRAYPEWQEDIWPGLDQNCSSCHSTLSPTADPVAQQYFAYSNEAEAYDDLTKKKFANTILGALGSPAFWAARGERTDGRDNSLPEFQPNFAAQNYGYLYSNVHSSLNTCDGSSLERARWVNKFGDWIDNHVPRNRNNTYRYQDDWYHPSVDSAIVDGNCAPSSIRVGYWDDSGELSNLDIELNGQILQSLTNLSNGSSNIALPSVRAEDIIKVTATDNFGNRQSYEKTVLELENDCRHTDGLPIIPPPTIHGNGNNGNSGTGSSSGGNSAGNGNSSSSATITPVNLDLRLTSRSVKFGETLSMSIYGEGVAGDSVVLALSSKPAPSSSPGLTIPFTNGFYSLEVDPNDPLLNSTLGLVHTTFSASGVAEFRIPIPKNHKGPTTFYIGAFSFDQSFNGTGITANIQIAELIPASSGDTATDPNVSDQTSNPPTLQTSIDAKYKKRIKKGRQKYFLEVAGLESLPTSTKIQLLVSRKADMRNATKVVDLKPNRKKLKVGLPLAQRAYKHHFQIKITDSSREYLSEPFAVRFAKATKNERSHLRTEGYRSLVRRLSRKLSKKYSQVK